MEVNSVDFTYTYIAVLIAAVIYRLWRVKRTHSQKKIGGKIYAKSIYPIMFILYLLVVVASMIEYFIYRHKVNLLISGMGFLMYTSAIPIREWAIKSLGDYMSEDIKIRRNHKLIKDGPYRYLRHPLLFCLLIEILGITLIPNSYYSFVVACLFYIPLIFIRMKLEEKALIEKFGKEYLDYKKEVYALLPLRRVRS